MSHSNSRGLARKIQLSGQEGGFVAPFVSAQAQSKAIRETFSDVVCAKTTIQKTLSLSLPSAHVEQHLADFPMLGMIKRTSGERGIVAMDIQLTSAIVESQTTGMVFGKACEGREITVATAALCAPVIDGIFSHLSQDIGSSDYYRFLHPVRHVMSALSMLGAQKIRLNIFRVCLENGVKGHIAILFDDYVENDKNEKEMFSDPIARQALDNVPTTLNAVIHRQEIALSDLKNFELGQVLILPMDALIQVDLITATGDTFCKAELGKLGDQRGVRLEIATNESDLSDKENTLTQSVNKPELISKSVETLNNSDVTDEPELIETSDITKIDINSSREEDAKENEDLDDILSGIDY